MEVFVHRCAGFDVHRDTVVATVRVPGPGRRRRVQHTRTFATTTAGIAALVLTAFEDDDVVAIVRR